MIGAQKRETELICLCSGKGGAGKTLFSSCLGYALTKVGLRVLMIDGDQGTAGLSLFLLGPTGMHQAESFGPLNTFSGVLDNYRRTGSLQFEPRKIFRNGPNDHGVTYDALISGTGLYGEQDNSLKVPLDPEIDRDTFRNAIRDLYAEIRRTGNYDYVIIDTRGGFAFESTDLCGFADSFIVVIEADPTSFYQVVNLIRRIDEASGESGSKSTLRAFLVNKALDGLPEKGNLDLSKVELSFRAVLTQTFPGVKIQSTHPVPADLEVLHSYKEQMVPFIKAPASLFTYATLSAYSEIFKVVTSCWSESQVEGWQDMANSVSTAIEQRNKETETAARRDRVAKGRWKYAIAATVIMMLLFSFAFSWTLTRYGRQDPVTELTRLGWTVQTGPQGANLQFSGNPPFSESLEFARQLRVSRVSISDISDISGIERWAELPGLSQLELSGSLSDIFSLRSFVRLSQLSLSHTNVHDLRPLNGLRSLRSLDLSYTPASNLTALQNLTNLTSLDADGTLVTDISPLQDLLVLSTLGLADTGVTDIYPLRKLSNLSELDLSDTSISNLTPLIGLNRLSDLNLNGSDVSDASPLLRLQRLKKLDIRETKLENSRSIDMLKRENPAVAVLLTCPR
jgi:MinD-like ATPase involved in chromosome partitioning or flagellar assembly